MLLRFQFAIYQCFHEWRFTNLGKTFLNGYQARGVKITIWSGAKNGNKAWALDKEEALASVPLRRIFI
jgi:hypothetical protein